MNCELVEIGEVVDVGHYRAGPVTLGDIGGRQVQPVPPAGLQLSTERFLDEVFDTVTVEIGPVFVFEDLLAFADEGAGASMGEQFLDQGGGACDRH